MDQRVVSHEAGDHDRASEGGMPKGGDRAQSKGTRLRGRGEALARIKEESNWYTTKVWQSQYTRGEGYMGEIQREE